MQLPLLLKKKIVDGSSGAFISGETCNPAIRDVAASEIRKETLHAELYG